MKSKKIASISFERDGAWIQCGSLLYSNHYYLFMDSIPLNTPCICKPHGDGEYIQGDIETKGGSKLGFIYTDESVSGDYHVLMFLTMPTGSAKTFVIKRDD